MSRYYILTQNDLGERYVVAETPDDAWATDQVLTSRGAAVLSEDEGLLDPDFREAILRWKAGDDSAFQAEVATLDAEAAADDAIVDAANAGDPDAERIYEERFDPNDQKSDVRGEWTGAQVAVQNIRGDVFGMWYRHLGELERLGIAESTTRILAKEFLGLAQAYGEGTLKP